MTEAQLKGRLVKYLKKALPGVVIFRHEDYFTAGMPDLSVTWRGRTSWVEAKRLTKNTPYLKSKKIQTDTAILLAQQGSCFYVVWDERNAEPATMLIAPLAVKHHQAVGGDFRAFARFDGYDHGVVAREIEKRHNVDHEAPH